MATQFIFRNFFNTELLIPITALTTEITISTDAATDLGAIGASEEIRLTLWDGQLDPEIVGCVSNPLSGVLTIHRAQEGTTAQAWPAGTQIMCTLTADVINQALSAYFNFMEVLNANFLSLTGGTLTGGLILNDNPIAALGAATKQYVDNIQGDKLPLAGGTMAGTINMNGNRILSLPAAIASTEPARKTDVDTAAADQALVNADLAGALVTAGTSIAYTVTNNVGQTVLTDGIRISIRPHTANGVAATLTLNGLAAKPIYATPNVDIPPATMQQDIPVDLVYSTAYTAWLLVSRPTAWFSAGDLKLTLKSVADAGWLMMNDQTIGDTSSGATFADASAKALYVIVYNAVSDTYAPVTGGRGASAAADWAAQKKMALTKVLGRALAVAGAGSGLTSRALGLTVGEETHVLTIPELPTVTPAGTISGGTVPAGTTGSGGGAIFNLNASGTATVSAQTFTGTPFGSGTAHNNMQPSSFINMMIKL